MKSETLSDSLLKDPDIALIGGGIMSATLGTMLKQLDPGLTIQILEALPQVGQESSHPWNNAGTGHAGLCELNYTPEMPDGSIDTSKALRTTQQFEYSKHFWAYLVERGVISDPSSFIRPLPHMSFVRGAENQAFLRKRHQAMIQSHFFSQMEFSTDHNVIGSWAPLLVDGRPTSDTVAATRVDGGTDLNFGALTEGMIKHLVSQEGVALALNSPVVDLNRRADGRWEVVLRGGVTLSAKFVFIGAGGGALPLLQKSGIPEGKGYGGFPVSGLFISCQNEAVVQQHNAKVYGLAEVGAPPMSVPHLDTRTIDGEKVLLFGPYAGFSPKYQKSGSYLDLFKAIKPDNLLQILAAGWDNLSLVTYLVKEVFRNHNGRCDMLRTFYPAGCNQNWELYTAGQRVQIIKKDAKRFGRLQFGTEVVASADGSLAALLGPSPGASTSPNIMLQVLEKCFPSEMESEAWRDHLTKMLPAYKINLAEDVEAYRELNARATRLLKLQL